MRLGYTPTKLLESVNRMQQMSTFSQDQCVRMLEALSDSQSANENTEQVKNELFDKFFRQLEKHSLALNSYNVCRAFHCLEVQSRQEGIQSNKSALLDLQIRTKFLVDRLTDMLSREQDVAVLDLYWSNKFVCSIDKVLQASMQDDPNSA